MSEANKRTAKPKVDPASSPIPNPPLNQARASEGSCGERFDDFRRDTGLIRESKVGSAVSFLIPQRQMADYAETWMNRNRRNSDDCI